MKTLSCLALLALCGLLVGCDGPSVPAGQNIGITPMPDIYLDPPGGYYPDTSLSSLPPLPPPEFFNPPSVYAEPAQPVLAPAYEAVPLAPAPLVSPY